MKKIHLSIIFLSLLSLISGCSTLDSIIDFSKTYENNETNGTNERLCADDNGEFYPCKDMKVFPNEVVAVKQGSFQPGTNFQSLGDYTEQMVYVLFNKLNIEQVNKSIAVPPFLSLVPMGRVGSNLTVDLAEFFVADMQNVGLPVAEYVSTYSYPEDNIDYLSFISEVEGNESFGYILKGTMRENSNGIMLHVKIIDMDNKSVIASTSKLLPNYLISKLNE